MTVSRKYTAKVTERRTEKSVERSVEVPITEGYVDMKLPQKHRFNNGGFLTVFQKAILNIAIFANLSKEEYKMLLYLFGSVGVDNSIAIDLNRLSEELNMKKPNVSRALKGLVSRNIVLRRDGYRYGNNPLPFELKLNYDQINYNVAYNGKTKEFKKKLEQHPEINDDKGNVLNASTEISVPHQLTIGEEVEPHQTTIFEGIEREEHQGLSENEEF